MTTLNANIANKKRLSGLENVQDLLRALSKSQNWPGGPNTVQIFWQRNRLFSKRFC